MSHKDYTSKFKRLSKGIQNSIFMSYNSIQQVTQSLARGKIETAIELINKEPFSQSEDSRKRFSIYLYFILKLEHSDMVKALNLLEETCGYTRTFLNSTKINMKELISLDKHTFSVIIQQAILSATTLREEFVIAFILD